MSGSTGQISTASAAPDMHNQAPDSNHKENPENPAQEQDDSVSPIIENMRHALEQLDSRISGMEANPESDEPNPEFSEASLQEMKLALETLTAQLDELAARLEAGSFSSQEANDMLIRISAAEASLEAKLASLDASVNSMVSLAQGAQGAAQQYYGEFKKRLDAFEILALALFFLLLLSIAAAILAFSRLRQRNEAVLSLYKKSLNDSADMERLQLTDRLVTSCEEISRLCNKLQKLLKSYEEPSRTADSPSSPYAGAPPKQQPISTDGQQERPSAAARQPAAPVYFQVDSLRSTGFDNNIWLTTTTSPTALIGMSSSKSLYYLSPLFQSNTGDAINNGETGILTNAKMYSGDVARCFEKDPRDEPGRYTRYKVKIEDYAYAQKLEGGRFKLMKKGRLKIDHYID